MHRLGVLALATVILAGLGSCSSGHDPSAPPALSERASASRPERVSWGIWDVTIDPATSEVEIVPLRGASFQANVVNFLQPPGAPIHLLTISIDPGGTNFPAGKVTCDVTLKHPFPGTQFCGFDVMGIILDDWQPYPLSSDPAILSSRTGATLLTNADGWTRWWNQPEFTTYGTLLGYIEGAKANHNWTSTHTLNAFKYFADSIGPEDPFEPSLSNRGFFSSSDPGFNKRRYVLQFYAAGGVQFHFKYAISANWIKPYDTAEPPYTPQDWPVEANMPEAYKIDLLDNGSTAYYENESTYGGDLNLLLEVRDWQFDGEMSNVKTEFLGITIESPTLFPDPIELNLDDATPYEDDPTRIVVPAFVPSVTPTDVNGQLLIVTVRSAHVMTYEPQIGGISGFDYPDGPLAAYNMFEAPIGTLGPQNLAPVADASASSPTSGDSPLDVNLDPSLSYDSDGTIVLYEWDFESDGTYDTSSATPDVVPHTFPQGQYTVTLRVTDNDGGTDTDELLIQSGCYSAPDWLTFRHDNKRTGRSSVPGPLTDHLKFTWYVPGSSEPIMSGITIDSKSRALFRCNDGYIYCVDSSGTLAWSYQVGGTWDYCTPTLDPQGNVYVGNTIGELYCFDSEGGFLWSKAYNLGSIGGGISVQADGSIVFTTHGGYLVKTLPNGDVDWTFPTWYIMPDGPSIGDDGTIYIANHGGQVYAVDQKGGQVWMTQVGSNEMSSTPALGPNGLYIGDWGGNVYGLDYEGGVKWTKHLSGDSISSFAAVDCEGKVYIGSRDDRLYCLDQETGEVKWSYLTCGDIGTMSPVLDGAGRVYVGSYCGHFYCFEADDGDLIWDKDLELEGQYSMYCKSPAITNDGTVLVGSNYGMLFAFQDE